TLTYIVVTQPAHGTLTGTAPALTYTPATGFVGGDSFTFKVNDGMMDSATTAKVSIVVNAPPVATAKSMSTNKGVAKAFTLTGTDADGNTLTYIVVTQPAHGTLTGTAPALTYTPATGFVGGDSFTFKVNDGMVDSATTAKVSIVVNTPPVATTKSMSTNKGVAKAFTLTGTDADGNSLTYIVVTQPAHGILTGTAPALTYTPAMGFVGGDSFTFKVNDGMVDSAITAKVSIVVNTPPVATAQSVYVNKGIAKAITLAASDADGNTLTYTVVMRPTHGILTGTAPKLTYTPTAGYLGTDSLTFKVNDGTVDSAVATVSITVSEPLTNVVLTQNLATPQSANMTINLKATATGGAGLLYQFLVNSAVVRDYLATDSYAWKPTIAGTYTLTVKAKDANAVVVTSAAVSYKIMPKVTLVASLATPRPINTTITLTASALGMTAPRYSFRISYKDRWGRTIYSVQQAYGVANTLAWKPTVAGTYTITVLARESTSTAAYDATQSLSYVITAL
ncbi:MAG: Ig-like domain-containing protein, partial [bacterium]